MAYSNGLDDKVALVTGGSRGIGAAISRRLADDGATVVVGYARNESLASEMVESIVADGGKAKAIRADLADPEEIGSLFDETIAAFGKLDILVNNAGAPPPVTSLAEASLEDFDAAFAVNARGTFLALGEAARRISDGGRIVNISSVATAFAPPSLGIYSASKAAIEQFTFVLAKEVGERGVTVNAVSPGSTPGGNMFLEDTRETVLATNPLGRLGRPEDVADVVAFLVGERARWVTGQNITASGGGS